jgi:Leucine-rich repeat (LRR) protein
MLKNLKSINLSNNSIHIRNLARDTVQNVQQLILSFNHLEAVPKEIGFFPELKELQLAENKIVSENIDPAIGSLKKLEMLSFYKNNLTEVPAYFFNSPYLIEFDIYYNKVEKIPETLTHATQLERLFLANNRIYQLPENLGNLTHLKELYLHHNRISYLPESLRKLTKLTDFHVQNNYLTSFPSCVLSFKNLQDLDISSNEIHSIPSEITSLTDLKYLWIREITFEAGSKEEAESIKQILEQLQKQGVKVSTELDQENL